MQNLIEYWRQISTEELFKTATFEKAYNQWKKNGYLKLNNIDDVFSLGSQLSEIFLSTSSTGRTQSEVRSAGNVWECFVAWYLNLLTVGSDIVFIKSKKKLVPNCIYDAITVNYGPTQSNSEPDVFAIKFNSDSASQKNTSVINDLLNKDKDDFSFEYNGKDYSLVKKLRSPNYKNFPELIDCLVQNCFEDTSLSVIQCKTNWNDTAQIPMLWDTVYSSVKFKNQRITLGNNGWNLNGLRSFYYSFVTVPTNKNAVYKSDSTAVKRVSNLSGGHYWGKNTEQSIARCINELPSSLFNLSIKTHLKNHLSFPIQKEFSYFRI